MTLLAAKTRSGLVETTHEGAVAVVSADGRLVASSGDIDRPFYLRSAAKPFQAFVAQDSGAALAPTRLALAAASHDGEPVHLAVVESMLTEVGLTPQHLKCPPAWPLSTGSQQRLAAAGHRGPRPIWSNCSGKHAAWLRACVLNDWPLDSYLDPGHVLQKRIIELVGELGEWSVEPVGVDGCGAPVLRTTTRVMALLYARLASSPLLDEVFATMHRYPALVSGSGNGDARIAIALDAVAKRGAEGCLGVALRNRLGVAAKSWDGLQPVAEVAAIAVLDALGALPGFAREQLAVVARPAVLGGGEVVGGLEPRVELQWM